MSRNTNTQFNPYDEREFGDRKRGRRGRRPSDRRGPGHHGPRGGHGPHGGPHGGPRGHHGRGRGRAQRGDVRAAVLLLLGEEAMHGYQLMRTIAERTSDAWRPSAGAIYPTLAQLEDEGLVITTQEGGRRLATLTQAGRDFLANEGASLGDPFAAFARNDGPDLRAALRDLQGAARQLSMVGTEAQVAEAATILATAKRDLYLLLAGDND